MAIHLTPLALSAAIAALVDAGTDYDSREIQGAMKELEFHVGTFQAMRMVIREYHRRVVPTT